MERLGGLDAAFLYFETPTMHMHICGLLILDPSTMPGGYSFAKIRDLVSERAPLIPGMRPKLATVPLNLSRPYWIEDPSFDLDYHLRRIAVPAPGGDRELADIVGDIASRPLDRAKPLWEMWVVEGLENGYVALVAKMHHSIIDGVSGANLMFYLFDIEPEPKNPPVGVDTWEPERRPGDLSLLAQGLFDVVRRPLGVARLTPGTAGKVAGLVWSRWQGRWHRSPVPFTAPRTSFNATITPHRKVAFVEVSLDDVKTVKAAFGVKVNDVVTAIVSGALRRYLADRDELPDKP